MVMGQVRRDDAAAANLRLAAKRLEEIDIISRRNLAQNLPAAMDEYKAAKTEAKKEVAAMVKNNPRKAGEIAKDASSFSFLPPSSKQYSANLMARGEIAGIVIPLKPMVGIGHVPAVPIPSSHNAGDFGAFLVGAPHEYALTEEQLEMRTDGHMDINEVVEGSIVICPVKVEGGGI